MIKKSKQFCLLKNSFENGTLGHCFLLVSKDDALKDAFIKCFCQLVVENSFKIESGTHPDVVFFPQNGNKNLVVEDVEQIIASSVIKPAEANFKAFIIDTNENFSVVCQNKMLKILEEPPKHLFMVVCCKSSNTILPTVASRLNKIYLDKLTKQEFTELGYSEELFYESNGNLLDAQMLKTNNQHKKVFDDCVLALESLNSSNDILFVARKLLDKKNIELILNNFSNIFEQVVGSKATKEKCFFEKIENDYSLLAISKIVEALDLAKQKVKANCQAQSILDCVLISIVEEKVKWQKKV